MIPGPTCRSKQSEWWVQGFSLIEIIIAIAIIAFVVAIGVPKLRKNLGSEVKALTRKMITLNKELHHTARMKQKTYRLVFEFGDPQVQDRIYVESASSRALAADPEELKRQSSFREEERIPDPFNPDVEVLKKPIEIPPGAIIESVEIADTNEIIKKGKAYVHFFPQGLTQKAIITISNGDKLIWSLIITPLTGQTLIKTEKVTLRDLE